MFYSHLPKCVSHRRWLEDVHRFDCTQDGAAEAELWAPTTLTWALWVCEWLPAVVDDAPPAGAYCNPRTSQGQPPHVALPCVSGPQGMGWGGGGAWGGGLCACDSCALQCSGQGRGRGSWEVEASGRGV